MYQYSFETHIRHKRFDEIHRKFLSNDSFILGTQCLSYAYSSIAKLVDPAYLSDHINEDVGHEISSNSII